MAAGAPAAKESNAPTGADPTAQAMLAALTGAHTAADWLRRAGIPKSTFYRHKGELLSAGRVVEIEGRFRRAA
jgi:hypothetical protein